MSMHKILSLAVVAGAFALYGVPANAESLPEIVNRQVSDRAVPSYSGAETGSDASVAAQQIDQISNTGDFLSSPNEALRDESLADTERH